MTIGRMNQVNNQEIGYMRYLKDFEGSGREIRATRRAIVCLVISRARVDDEKHEERIRFACFTVSTNKESVFL
jgi:hypothetical protein